MGSSASYVKVKVQTTVISVYYEHNKIYYLRTINGHPNELKNEVEHKSYNHYNNYSGGWYSYDGNSATLHRILSDFQPHYTPTAGSNVKSLFETLKCRCDLEKYENPFCTFCRWIVNVLDVCLKIPQAIMGATTLKKLIWCSDDEDKDKDKEN